MKIKSGKAGKSVAPGAITDPREEAWQVVGGWLNRVAEHHRGADGQPWLPRVDVAKSVWENVDLQLRRLLPPT